LAVQKEEPLTGIAESLAEWAFELRPTDDDLVLAERSLLDTVAATLAAREHWVAGLAAALPEAGCWAAIGHVLDFDDLHMESTTHISVVCVPAVLAVGGGARDYLAAAGVMARLGNALGWRHYSAGWHATCTAGAPAAAAGAAVAMGLDKAGIATAMALAVPGAGGVQRAFGADGKALQVGFAVDAGVRAARLAAAGARAELDALDSWLAIVGGDAARLDLSGPAVPGGLATKIYPACYALQRPISAISGLMHDEAGIDPASITRIVLHTPAATVLPLFHHRPLTGLQGKFSVEYAAAAAVLDSHQGFESFTDSAVQRADAQRLIGLVEVDEQPGGDWLLDGQLEVDVHTSTGQLFSRTLQYPPGSPQRPPTEPEFQAKLRDCLTAARLTDLDPAAWTWDNAPDLLRAQLRTPSRAQR
jgi:2-methylcitrate dehydratase PrpD